MNNEPKSINHFKSNQSNYPKLREVIYERLLCNGNDKSACLIFFANVEIYLWSLVFWFSQKIERKKSAFEGDDSTENSLL